MRSVMDMLRAREASAAPVTVDGVTVTPRSRALVVRLPKGGLVWHRPTAVRTKCGSWCSDHLRASELGETAMLTLRFPCSLRPNSGEVMRCEPAGPRAGCQGRSSVGRSTLTAGHRCPTCTTIPGAIMLASTPGEEGSSPGPLPLLRDRR
jgi:hypothetical protein